MQIRKILAAIALLSLSSPSFAEEHSHADDNSSVVRDLPSELENDNEHKKHDAHENDGKHVDHGAHENDGKRGEHRKHDEHGAHDEHGDGEDSDGVELPKEAARKAGITLSIATEKAFSEIVSLPGEIAVNGDSIVHLAPRFEGTLTKVFKHVGEEVRAGETLAIVQSNQSLASYTIKAASSGVVIDKDASLGEFVTNSKIIFTIANFETVWVNAAVQITDLSSLQKGMNATVVSKLTKLSQEGTVDYIRPTLSEGTRTALARIVLDNKHRRWLPGMFVSVTARRSSKEKILIIPSESAVFVDNEYVAFVKSNTPDGDYAFERREIEVGRDNGDEIEVIKGLSAGEIVASGETFILKAELGKGSTGHSH
jgi:cobalt-zinc-cadmium efflux system membrane fusion protein